MLKKEITKIIEKAKTNKKILAVAIFGSAVNGNGRDTDICLFLDKKYSNLEMSRIRLEFLAESGKGIDIQIFQQLPMYIRIRIIKDGRMLICRDMDKLYELFFETIKDFEFYKKSYETYLNVVENG